MFVAPWQPKPIGMFTAPSTPVQQQLGLFAAPAVSTPRTRRGTANPAKRTFDPTTEQVDIVDQFSTGFGLVVEAGAGTGKTSTLGLIAESTGRRRGQYVAYNAAIAAEAASKMPDGVDCRTAHSLAFQAVGRRYQHRLPQRRRSDQASSRRLPATEVAKLLGLTGVDVGGRHLTAPALARLADTTVANFCKTGDQNISPDHVPVPTGVEEQYRRDLAAVVLPAARKFWADIQAVDGVLFFQHDHYLKMWQLSEPALPVDYILFDEAQDANPLIAAIVAAQDHAQLVYVGDRSQAIYGWNGAVDAMSTFDGHRRHLTKSFRFGPAIAAQANLWLTMLNADLRITGHDQVQSKICYIDRPDAVLCRTNAGAVEQCISHQAQGSKVALVGGGGEIKRFAFAAMSLMQGRGCDLPELAAFKTWASLITYVTEEPSGSDLKTMVALCQRFGPSRIIDVINSLVTEKQAQIVISTAHKAKGLEWDRVSIGPDFAPPADGEPLDRAELMLAYVSVTRAKQQLCTGSLNWPATGRTHNGLWFSHGNPELETAA